MDDIKVEGFEDLFKRMDELAQEIGQGKTNKIWRNALGSAMAPVLATAKGLAPVRTGQLRDNIYLAIHKPKARDKSSRSYQGEVYMARVTVSAVRNDTVVNSVLQKNGKFRTNKSNLKQVPISQEFGNEHLKNSEFGTAANGAHPFMRPALESNYQNIVDNLAKSLWYELSMGKYAKE